MNKGLFGLLLIMMVSSVSYGQLYNSYKKHFRKDKDIYFSPELNVGFGTSPINPPDTGGYSYEKKPVLINGLSLQASIKLDQKGHTFIKTGIGFQKFGAEITTNYDFTGTLSEEEKSFLPDSLLASYKGGYNNWQTNQYLVIPITFFHRGDIRKPSYYFEGGIYNMLYLNTRVKDEYSGILYGNNSGKVDTTATYETVREFNVASHLGFGLNIPKKRYMMNIGFTNQFTFLPIYAIKEGVFKDDGRNTKIRYLNFAFQLGFMF